MSDNLKHEIDDEVTVQQSTTCKDNSDKLPTSTEAQPQGGVGDTGQVAVFQALDRI